MKKIQCFWAPVFLLFPSLLLAYRLGQLEVLSGQNEPLEARIPVYKTVSEKSEEFHCRLASPEAFALAGVERKKFEGAQIHLTLKNGKTFIEIKTDAKFSDSRLKFLLEFNGTSGAIVREYTAFLEPRLVFDKKTASKTGRSHVVHSSDNLWFLSDFLKNKWFSDASRFQILMAIYFKNPDAFMAGSIDKLKVGFPLLYPSRTEVFKNNPSEAYNLFLKVNKGMQKMVDSVDTAVQLAHHSEQLSEPDAENFQVLVPETDGVTLESTEKGPEWDDWLSLTQGLALAQEGLALKEEEAKLMNERLSRLEKAIDAIESLQSIQNESLKEIHSAPWAPSWDAHSFLLPYERVSFLTPLEPTMHASDKASDRWTILSALVLAALSFLIAIYLLFEKMRAPKNQQVIGERENQEEERYFNNMPEVVVEKANPSPVAWSKAEFDKAEWRGMDSNMAELDLARLYIQMDEKHRARGLLKPLLQSADLKIKLEAEALLHELSDQEEAEV